MGQTPSIVNASHLAWLEEYHSNCVLSRLSDVFVFWYNSVNKKLISKDDFDILFGSIPGLSDGHFDLYADDSIGRASFHEILFTMILFANDSIRHKIFFIMKLKFLCAPRGNGDTIVTTGNNPPEELMVDSTYVYESFYSALCGLQHVFNVRIPEHMELQRIWEVSIEEMNKRNRTFDLLEKKKKKQYRNLYELTITELYDLCLDMKDCSNYFGAIEEICDHLLTYKYHIAACKKLYDANKHDLPSATSIGGRTTDDRCISKSSICAYMLKEAEAKAKQALEKQIIGQGRPSIINNNNSDNNSDSTPNDMSKGQSFETFTQRMGLYQRHPLWDFVVLDLSNESWQDETPRSWHDDEVTILSSQPPPRSLGFILSIPRHTFQYLHLTSTLSSPSCNAFLSIYIPLELHSTAMLLFHCHVIPLPCYPTVSCID